MSYCYKDYIVNNNNNIMSPDDNVAVVLGEQDVLQLQLPDPLPEPLSRSKR